MYNSKIVELYKSFDSAELKRLTKFIQSDFNNESLIIEKIHKFLISFHPSYGVSSFTKADLYNYIYPGEEAKDNKLRYFLSRLTRLVERFIIIEQIELDDESRNFLLLKGLRERKCYKSYQSIAGELKKKIESIEVKNDKAYYSSFLLEEELSKYYEKTIQRSSQVIQDNISGIIKNVDLFFLLSKLKYLCVIENFKNVLSFYHEPLFKDEIISACETEEYNSPSINIYYRILKSITNPEQEEHFRLLKELLQIYAGSFSIEEANNMYVFAQNYCIKKVNTGNVLYLHSLLDLYKETLSSGLIFENGKLSPFHYKNIVTIALRCNEFDWTQQFINSHLEYVPSSNRENARIYNQAKYHFYKKEFDKVIELLQQVEYKDVFYGLDSRAMLLKTYYELDEFEAMDSLSSSFRIFLSRKKVVADHHREGYSNFIKLVKKASGIIPGDQKKIDKVKSELKDLKHIADVNWINDKIKELEK